MGKKKKKKAVAQPIAQDDWQVRSAADTLIEAEKIKQNGSLMGKVKKEINNRQKALQKVSKKIKK